MTGLLPAGVRDRHVLARRLAAPRRPRAIVLCYHRIGSPADDPQGLGVLPSRFADHLAVLAAERRPVLPLADLLARARAGRVPHRAVALTFDDGYADNLTTAVPLLTAAGAAATVFVTTDWIGGRHEAWWDELTVLLGHDADAYRRALEDLRTMSGSERAVSLQALREREGRSASPPRAGHEPLTPEQLVRLSDVPGVDIGGHTASHPSLMSLAIAEQRAEIVAGRDRLTDLLGRRPTVFAYPFGARGRDYDARSAAAVREAGFVTAVGTDPGPVTASSRRLAVSRILIGDWDADTFARRLRRAMLF